jgi:hypothetical protein
MSADRLRSGPFGRDLVIHSDHRSRFRLGFSELIRTKRLIGSMGTIGDTGARRPKGADANRGVLRLWTPPLATPGSEGDDALSAGCAGHGHGPDRGE